MSFAEIPMHTTPAATRRLDGFKIRIGEPFVIAGREEGLDEGSHIHPMLWKSSDTLFLNWNIDQDILDALLPDRPTGRLSRDGGRTWQRQTVLAPPWCAYKIMTGPTEITSYWHAFEIPGSPGRYRMATWRSPDNGRSWGDMTWTELEYPGTRGLDPYDPPEIYKSHVTHNMQRPAPPAYMESLYRQAGTRKRLPAWPGFYERAADSNGTLYGLTYGTLYVPGGENIADERTFWEKVDWTRWPILMHKSSDCGRTWTYAGVVAHDEKHKLGFCATDVFSEPSMAVYPDGEMVCVMRTGSFRPLYLVRSFDAGATWSEPVKLPVRSVTPILVQLPGGVLALATGRPDCAVHFSLDRGATWPLSETLYRMHGMTDSGPDEYNSGTANVQLIAIDDNTLLYVHDACRYDPNGTSEWLKRGGHGRIIGRHIFVEKSRSAARVKRPAGVRNPVMKQEECPTVCAAETVPEAVALRREKKKLALDGKLDDPFWDGLETYTLRLATNYRLPTSGLRTTFRVAWADKALHIGFDCRENDMKNLNIGSSTNGDPKIWNGDNLDLLIQTQTHTYYQIAISPSGAVVGADRDLQNGVYLRWSPDADVATHMGKNFWSVELRLPVVDPEGGHLDPLHGMAGQKPTDSSPWYFNLCRQRMRGLEGAIQVFSKIDFGMLFHETTTFGKLVVR